MRRSTLAIATLLASTLGAVEASADVVGSPPLRPPRPPRSTVAPPPERQPAARCYCGKKARKVALYEGRRLPVCSAYCGQRLPKRVAELRGAT